jgi:hypothetical protein
VDKKAGNKECVANVTSAFLLFLLIFFLFFIYFFNFIYLWIKIKVWAGD